MGTNSIIIVIIIGDNNTNNTMEYRSAVLYCCYLVVLIEAISFCNNNKIINAMYRRDDGRLCGAVACGKRYYGDGRGALSGLAAATVYQRRWRW